MYAARAQHGAILPRFFADEAVRPALLTRGNSEPQFVVPVPIFV
jgi:hypothetical protein